MCHPCRSIFLAILGFLVVLTIGVAPIAARAEQRIALVVGNASYPARSINSAANDAGLIAQTLEAAGFEVTGARDLDQDALRGALRDFLDKAGRLGSDDVALVYLSGYGLQLEGENYFVPLDARIERAADVPVQAIRLSDYTRALGAIKLKASIVVLDLARNHPFALEGEPLAGGLALVEPEPGMLVAFNAAPGTIAPAAEGAYSPYAKALAEMIREGGMPPDELFDRVRLRVSDVTQGAQVPWHDSNAVGSFVFFERTAEAPPQVAASESGVPLRSRALRDLGANEAYIAALERDALPDYLEFLDTYADSPLASRVWAIVAARRESLIWRRTRLLDTPAAYWSYLRLYSQGPHVSDCYRRLSYLHASLEPTPDFDAVAYDIPPPVPQESTFIEQSAVFFGDPTYDFAPPPPIPEDFLPPPSPALAELPPPEVPETPFLLPTPVYIPVPVWVRPPHQLQPPTANNVIFANLHSRVVSDRASNTISVTDQAGRTRTLQPAPVSRSGDWQQGRPGAQRGELPTWTPNIGPALPPSVAELTGQGGRPTRPGDQTLQGAQRDERRGVPLQQPAHALPQVIPPLSAQAAPNARPRFGSQHPERQQQQQRGQPQQEQAAAAARQQQQPHLSIGSPPQPLAPAAPPGRRAQPAQALPQVVPPSSAQAAPNARPWFGSQHPERQQQQQPQQEQAAAAARQQQAAQAAAAARQQQAAQAAAAARQQQPAQAAAAARQQQPAQAAAAARQQQPAQAAAAARQQQAAQAAAAARQQQAAQAAAAARQQQAAQAAAARQQQAAQAAAAARQQQAAQAAAAARQQQAAQAAAAARQQQAAQAAAARQQQAAQGAAAARQQQAAQAAAAARQQQAAQAAAAARQQQAAQAAATAHQQQAAQAAAAARQQQQAAQAIAAARASAAIAAARAQHVPGQRR